MDNVKSDGYFLTKIIQDCEFITAHMQNVSKSELTENEVLLDSMLFRMIQISENAKRLTDTYKLEHGNIPWTALYGLRNKIVHDYGHVSVDIIYDTLKNDIPDLLKRLS